MNPVLRSGQRKRPHSLQANANGAVRASHLLDRLIFLSDGVFAIAMTLLAVELTLPALTSSDSAALSSALLALGPKYLSFGISFLVIATYWSSHQRIFSYIVRCDGRLVWLNLLLLLCIAFQPFPTTVLGAYSAPPAVTFYAGTLAVTGVVVLGLWLYATSGRRLVRTDLDPRLIRHHTMRAACVPLVFLVSMGIAQVNPTAAELSWFAIGVLIGALRWLYRAAN
jgi:uncharacterized membrane protein